MKTYIVTNRPVKAGEMIQNKNDRSYIGKCTKISESKNLHNDIHFPYLDGKDFPCGSTIDQWQVIEEVKN